MAVQTAHDRAWLAGILRRDPALRAYELGDLDDFFWPYTTWYRHGDRVVLLYHGGDTPVLLALDRPEHTGQLGELLADLLAVLPRRFETHLSPGLDQVLAPAYRIDSRGAHLKMALTDPAALAGYQVGADHPPVEVLTPDDLAEVSALYKIAYPDNAFAERMLETGQYLGLRRGGELLAVAGVHVWSPTHRVCAVGNVTTRPDARGQGLGGVVVAALCRRVSPYVDQVTLNVKADNRAAVTLYTRLGFTAVAEYHEAVCTARAGQ